MIKEMEIQKDYLNGESIDTIYFGGGTPSILGIRELELFLDKSFELFTINPNPEITLEANPDDLSRTKLGGLYALGINRLSIGIQSFNDQVLNFLNRAHNAREAINCVNEARNAGFDNISTDLIFSIPGVDVKALEWDIKTTLSLNPEHVSAYSLTIEEKTVFGRWYKKGRFAEVNETESARQFELIISMLEENNYEQYEVSNFCRDGYYASHNSSYWKNVPYLGIGPGAHSYNRLSRQYNVSSNPAYLKSLNLGEMPFDLEMLDNTSKINEYLLTSLRTKWGCDLKKLREDYGYHLMEVCEGQIKDFLKRQLIRVNNEIMYLTKKGILLSDEIIGQLFLDQS